MRAHANVLLIKNYNTLMSFYIFLKKTPSMLPGNCIRNGGNILISSIDSDEVQFLLFDLDFSKFFDLSLLIYMLIYLCTMFSLAME